MEVAFHTSVRLSEMNGKKYVVNGAEPAAMFRHFEDIAAIPHGSGNEKGVADHIESFAASLGLYCYRDDRNNVLVRRPASPGYEEKPAVLLQGHMDMVCEKNGDTVHDFTRDGLELYMDNGYLRARGTTLGGDDGIAVAAMMTFLEEDFPHPVLECLFTVDEEVGLSGAKSFDYSKITAESIINLDYEGEGVACASSAGGMDNILTFEMDEIPFRGKAVEVKLFGFAGGHSGTDIDKGRASANIMMGRVLASLYDRYPFSLISLDGGNMRNAISRECTAVISVNDADESRDCLNEISRILHNTVSECDSSFRMHVSKHSAPEKMFTLKTTSAVISALTLAPHGVISMCAAKPDLVETSTNLGVIRTDGCGISMTWLTRSSVESDMDWMQLRFERLAKVTGAVCEHHGRYPGWQFRPCPLQDKYIETVKRITGKEGSIVAIHAGLECGIVSAGIEAAQGRTVDCIAMGPDMFDIHSPAEKLDIASCERFYRLVKELID